MTGIPDAFDQITNYRVNTAVGPIPEEDSVYLVGTMEISDTSGEYLAGTLFLEIATYNPLNQLTGC